MAAETKHTPTPWLRSGRTVYALGKTPGGDEVNVFQAGFSSSGPIRATEAEVEANAQLATAAPDLLEALRLFVDDGFGSVHRMCHRDPCRYCVAARAIARATRPTPETP